MTKVKNRAASETDLSQLAPSWSYHQVDQLESTYKLASYKQALNFIVSVIEIAEDSGLQFSFWFKQPLVSITIEISEDGAPEGLTEILEAIDTEAHNV